MFVVLSVLFKCCEGVCCLPETKRVWDRWWYRVAVCRVTLRGCVLCVTLNCFQRNLFKSLHSNRDFSRVFCDILRCSFVTRSCVHTFQKINLSRRTSTFQISRYTYVRKNLRISLNFLNNWLKHVRSVVYKVSKLKRIMRTKNV